MVASLISMFARNWWVYLVRGLAAITFGVAAFVWPTQTLSVVVMLFGVYLLVDGISLIMALALGNPVARSNQWAVILIGVIDVFLGVVALVSPNTFAASLLAVIAAWSIVTGTLQIVGAFYLRKVVEGEVWMAIGGVLSIAFGVLLVIYPAAGLLSLVWLVALWAIAFGVSSIVLSYRLHNLNNVLAHGSPA